MRFIGLFAVLALALTFVNRGLASQDAVDTVPQPDTAVAIGALLEKDALLGTLVDAEVTGHAIAPPCDDVRAPKYRATHDLVVISTGDTVTYTVNGDPKNPRVPRRITFQVGADGKLEKPTYLYLYQPTDHTVRSQSVLTTAPKTTVTDYTVGVVSEGTDLMQPTIIEVRPEISSDRKYINLGVVIEPEDAPGPVFRRGILGEVVRTTPPSVHGVVSGGSDPMQPRIVEVRPGFSPDRKYITLDVKPTVAWRSEPPTAVERAPAPSSPGVRTRNVQPDGRAQLRWRPAPGQHQVLIEYDLTTGIARTRTAPHDAAPHDVNLRSEVTALRAEVLELRREVEALTRAWNASRRLTVPPTAPPTAPRAGLVPHGGR